MYVKMVVKTTSKNLEQWAYHICNGCKNAKYQKPDNEVRY